MLILNSLQIWCKNTVNRMMASCDLVEYVLHCPKKASQTFHLPHYALYGLVPFSHMLPFMQHGLVLYKILLQLKAELVTQ